MSGVEVQLKMTGPEEDLNTLYEGLKRTRWLNIPFGPHCPPGIEGITSKLMKELDPEVPGVKLLREGGYTCVYDWMKKNWGTEHAEITRVDKKTVVEVRIDPGHGNVYPILNHIRAQFPNVTFDYADSDTFGVAYEQQYTPGMIHIPIKEETMSHLSLDRSYEFGDPDYTWDGKPLTMYERDQLFERDMEHLNATYEIECYCCTDKQFYPGFGYVPDVEAVSDNAGYFEITTRTNEFCPPMPDEVMRSHRVLYALTNQT
jgi:hypothetical protein